MKKNNTPLSLEDLLASVEHAGRDARRQQQLAEMIEQKAEEEAAAKRRSVRLWSVRLVAAACLLLFVLTFVRLWQPHPLSEGQPVAQASRSPQVPFPAIHMAPAQQDRDKGHPTVKPGPAGSVAPLPTLLPQPSIAEPIMEELTPDPLFSETPALEQYAKVEDEPVANEEQLPAALQLPDSTIVLAQAESIPEPETPEPRRKLFSLRHAEPSMMDGNVLSFRIL